MKKQMETVLRSMMDPTEKCVLLLDQYDAKKITAAQLVTALRIVCAPSIREHCRDLLAQYDTGTFSTTEFIGALRQFIIG